MSFDIKNAQPDDIWSDDSGETVKEALERFASFGPLVPTEDVPELLRAGHMVWSFGYGDDPEEFTTVDMDDLDNGWDPEEAERDWSPFRLDAESPLISKYAREGRFEDAATVGGWLQNGKWRPRGPSMNLGQALAIVQSRLEAVESVGGRVWTAIGVLGQTVRQLQEEDAAAEANPNGHQMGHNLCIYCLQYDEDPRETCPERYAEDTEWEEEA